VEVGEDVETRDDVADVEVDVNVDEVEDFVLEVEETPVLEEVLEEREESLYISNLFPAPQYSTLLPGQVKLQSPKAAGADPVPRLFPQ
jgi:hypothetical protein